MERRKEEREGGREVKRKGVREGKARVKIGKRRREKCTNKLKLSLMKWAV